MPKPKFFKKIGIIGYKKGWIFIFRGENLKYRGKKLLFYCLNQMSSFSLYAKFFDTGTVKSRFSKNILLPCTLPSILSI